MTIGIITDMHLPKQGELARKVDTWYSFTKVVEDCIAHEELDAILICGDLCFQDGDEDTYKEIATILDNTAIPYATISGNHDDSQLQSLVFSGQARDEYFYEAYMAGRSILCCDSSKGSMSKNQWDWLYSTVEQSNVAEQLIAIHHPPIYLNVPHMDQGYAFGQMEEWKSFLDNFPQKQFTVLSGHYHNEISAIYHNMTLYVTPSCFVQIDDRSETFSPYHKYPAYRRLSLDRNGNHISTVRYLFNNKT